MEVGSAGALRPGDPERLGGYALTGRLGEGGQGMVYLGRGEDGEPVAIKLLHQDLTGNERARARFLREVEVAKQVRSFCTARIIDVDVEDDRPYIVSEFVDGPSLRTQVEREGPLSGGALERLAIGTATALVVIHQADVVHRDLKPGNVLLGPDGPRVIDFGIAKPLDSAVTVSSRVLGTPAFMAPEQMRGKGVARPADIFAWASTIVHAATGSPPFGQDTIPAVVNRILHEEPDLGEIEEPLRSLLARCLDKDPDNRPDARQVLMGLLGQDTLPQVAGVPAAAAAFEEDPATEVLGAGLDTQAIAAVTGEGAPQERTIASPAGSPAGAFGSLGERLRRLNRRQWAFGGGLAAALVAAAIAFGVAEMIGDGTARQLGNNTRPSAPASSPTATSTPRPLVRPSTTEPTEERTERRLPSEAPTPTASDSGMPSSTPRPTQSHSTKPTSKPTVEPPKTSAPPTGGPGKSG